MTNQSAGERCHYAEWDGAYVLGALSSSDRTTFEAHLETCESCRASVRQLAGLPGLLSRVKPEQAADLPNDEPAVPETLWPQLVRRVEQQRRRSRWRTAATGFAAAAVLAAVLIGGAAIVRHPSHREPATISRTFQAAPGVSGLRAQAQVEELSWGTRIVMHCVSDATGYQPARYTMVVTDRSGAHETIGAWQAEPGKTVRIEGDTSLRTAQIARVEVHSPTGQAVLVLSL